MAKTYKITFKNKSSLGMVLYELNAWGVSPSSYRISKTELVIGHAGANVVDVVTESITDYYYTIETEKG